MRVLKCSLLLLVLILSVSVYSQEITKIVKSHVLINTDETSGLKAGNKVSVLRKTPTGEEKKIGRIEIVMFKEGKCVGKIISENPRYKIGVGDYIGLPKISQTKPSYSGGNKHLLSYLSVGTGIVACGLGYYFYDQAEQTYEDHIAASTQDERMRLYDRTTSFDTKSNFSFGIGGGLIAFGVINYLINRHNDSPSTYYEKPITVYPIQKNGCIGMGINLSLNYPNKQ
jgi:hypothetical protein